MTRIAENKVVLPSEEKNWRTQGKAVIYAAQVLGEYAKAARGHVAPLTSKEVAEKIDISIPYAQKINFILVKASIIKTEYPQGYSVSKPLEEISALDLLLAVDKRLATIFRDDPTDTKEMKTIRQNLRSALASGESVASLLHRAV